ncbi:Retrovirus-related Pol polyprotein from transposon 17.6, partial [Mucuna pruriens]
MHPKDKTNLVQLLKEYVDIFAWSYRDMLGLDKEIVEHKIPLEPHYPPIKQKLRRISLDVSLKIKEEVKKDRNRDSPKDDFPLPQIDILMDNIVRHTCFSFMDGFSGYNQIKMALEDMEKTTFITQWGTFCYKVMSFGLKNAGTTYQRAMVALLHDIMHREVEVYVDDMIAKSKADQDHVQDLKKLFERLRKYRLHLNSGKCTFEVKSGKLFGFIVSEKGIEVNPDKVRAILEMKPPQTEKEVRGFLRRINYIARFIS